MKIEKLENVKRIKLEKELVREEKERELKEQVIFERERKKELQKFIRFEQAQVRKEQAEKQRDFKNLLNLKK